MMLPKKYYWDRIVDYYYDHIHWDELDPPSIYEWLDRDYNASTNLNAKYIHFDDPAAETLFKLRWN